MQKIPVLVIFAPTASGKTALLKNLFAAGSPYFFKGCAEIISADSMQVYKGMDIGTAKPDAELLEELPHHLINLYTPDCQFSAQKFVEYADEACRSIWSRGKIPVVAGGTGFYIKAFLMGLPPTPPGNAEIRSAIAKRIESEGLDVLYAELCKIDMNTASRISPSDVCRISRALEVFECTGRPLSSFAVPQTLRTQYNFCTLILGRGRQELYSRINQRVEQMFSFGLPQEFDSLVRQGYSLLSPGMAAIGYREFFEYFPHGIGEISQPQTLEKLEKIKELVKKNTRHYAKKQCTLMKNIPGASFCPLTSGESVPATILQKISDFLAVILDVKS